MRWVLTLAIVVPVLTAGCTGATKAPGTGGAPAGTEAKGPGGKVVSSKDSSFSIELPPGWLKADRSDPDYNKLADKNKQSPAVQMIDSLAKQDMIQLIAVDPVAVEKGKPFVTNLNVVVMSVGAEAGKTDIKELADASAAAVFSGNKQGTTVVDTPNGKAGLYSGSTTLGNNQAHDLLGGVVLHNEKLYTVTLSAASGEGKALQTTFEAVMRSIKFK